MNRRNCWVTKVCEYLGNVYTREVGPFDTTVYMDRVLATVPWLNDEPNHDVVGAEVWHATSLVEAESRGF